MGLWEEQTQDVSVYMRRRWSPLFGVQGPCVGDWCLVGETRASRWVGPLRRSPPRCPSRRPLRTSKCVSLARRPREVGAAVPSSGEPVERVLSRPATHGRPWPYVGPVTRPRGSGRSWEGFDMVIWSEAEREAAARAGDSAGKGRHYRYSGGETVRGEKGDDRQTLCTEASRCHPREKYGDLRV